MHYIDHALGHTRSVMQSNILNKIVSADFVMISLSTVVLNSRDRHEKMADDFTRLKTHLTKGYT